jgi:hypothetical protein
MSIYNAPLIDILFVLCYDCDVLSCQKIKLVISYLCVIYLT